MILIPFETTFLFLLYLPKERFKIEALIKTKDKLFHKVPLFSKDKKYVFVEN